MPYSKLAKLLVCNFLVLCLLLHFQSVHFYKMNPSSSSSTDADSNDNDQPKMEDSSLEKSGLRSEMAIGIKTPEKNISADEENNNLTPIKMVDDVVNSLGTAIGRLTLSPTSKVLGSPRSITDIMVLFD